MTYIRQLILGLACACLWAATAYAAPLGFEELLDKHVRAMKPVSDVYNAQPVYLESYAGDPASKKLVTMHWQLGQYRSEMHWLGFTEVFGYDGKDNWYGSDLNLPYTLDEGTGLDITPQLVEYFSYLKPDQLQYLVPADKVPLELGNKYCVLKYTPPGMSEALLLLDPFNFRLAGMLQGTNRSLDDTMFYRLSTYEDWADFGGGVWYPGVVRLRTYTLDGELIRERYQTTQSAQVVGAKTLNYFQRVTSPAVPSAPLPSVPYKIPIRFARHNVEVKCTNGDGKTLWFEFDTGASVGYLRRDVARKLGLQPVGDEEVTGHGGNAQVAYARVEGVLLNGEVPLPAWPAAVLMNDGELDKSLAANNVAGLLGAFLLNKYVIQLDFRRRQMLLWPLDQFDARQELSANAYKIPVHRDSMPYVDITVDGKLKGGAFFNTGAQQFFTLDEWAVTRAGMSYPIETVGTGLTVHGITAFGIIRPKEVQLGDMVLMDPTTNLELLAPGEAPNAHRIGSFGSAFFNRYKVTFDLQREMYYIETM